MKEERGNVLFLILVAIAIYATLAYVVGQSTRTTGGDASKESAELRASHISQYNASIKNAVLRLRMGGCDETQISFETPLMAGYTNPNAPANYTCHVFRPEGGGVIFQTPVQLTGESGSTYAFTGTFSARADQNRFTWSTSRPPLLMVIMTRNEQVCRAIAKSADQTVDPNSCGEANFPNSSGFWNVHLFTGSYTGGAEFPDDPSCGTSFRLGETFCVKNYTSVNGYWGYDKYMIFHVLNPR